MSDKKLLDGLGELMDNETKNFVRHKLRSESISLMKFYQPISGLSRRVMKVSGRVMKVGSFGAPSWIKRATFSSAISKWHINRSLHFCKN